MKDRILFLVQVPPPVHGAALRNLSLVQSQLLQESFDIRLIRLDFANEIRDIGRPSLTKFLRLVKILARLTMELLVKRPRFVYFTLSPTGNAFYRDVLIVALIKLCRVPRVFHLRGLGIAEVRRNLIGRLLCRFVFRNSFVICLAQCQSAEFDGLRCRQVIVVPNGIRTEIAPRVVMPTALPRLLYLSNYVRSKGVIDFVEACGLLRVAGYKFSAQTVGEPYDVSTKELQALVDARNLHGIVEISGPIYGSAKFDTILACDVFVFPTHWELFPGVVLEAMQCGRPIVATRVGAIPEILSDRVDALLVSPKDTKQLADKVGEMLDDLDFRRRLGAAAASKFANEFTLQIFESNMQKVFSGIARELAG